MLETARFAALDDRNCMGETSVHVSHQSTTVDNYNATARSPANGLEPHPKLTYLDTQSHPTQLVNFSTLTNPPHYKRVIHENP